MDDQALLDRAYAADNRSDPCAAYPAGSSSSAMYQNDTGTSCCVMVSVGPRMCWPCTRSAAKGFCTGYVGGPKPSIKNEPTPISAATWVQPASTSPSASGITAYQLRPSLAQDRPTDPDLQDL